MRGPTWLRNPNERLMRATTVETRSASNDRSNLIIIAVVDVDGDGDGDGDGDDNGT